MKMKKMVVAVLLAAGLAACSKSEVSGNASSSAEGPQASEVAVDLSTPDKALKSFWAMRDAVRHKQEDIFQQLKNKFKDAAAPLDKVVTEEIARSFSIRLTPFETFSRDMIDVKVESESRAVIVAVIKNTTPVPAGAEVTKFDEEHRRDGNRYKYVLENSRSGWRVAEIWEWDTYPTADWKKRFPMDNKPSVQSLTYTGF